MASIPSSYGDTEYIELNQSFTAVKPSYDNFAFFQDKILSTKKNNIDLHINIEKRLGLTFLFCICTLIKLSDVVGKRLHLYCNEKSFNLFKKTGYIKKNIEFNVGLDIANLIEWDKTLRIVKCKDDVFGLIKEITTEAPVTMSKRLESIFITKLGEMFNNALEHSEGEFIIGGKYFKNQKYKYCFACYDTGIGIAEKVRKFIQEITTDQEAMKWALQKGNSTASRESGQSIPRGLGLFLLKSFAKANEGSIRICSGSVLYKYSKKRVGTEENYEECYLDLKNKFKGTLFEMDIIADNKYEYNIN